MKKRLNLRAFKSKEQNYIIEFLLQKGAEVKSYHVELAKSYELIYETNLNEQDMKFYDGNKLQKISAKICQYHMIAHFLQQELFDEIFFNFKKGLI